MEKWANEIDKIHVEIKEWMKIYDIASLRSHNGLQKVRYTAENCKWHHFSPDLGVTPRILFSGFRIFSREFCFGKLEF